MPIRSEEEVLYGDRVGYLAPAEDDAADTLPYWMGHITANVVRETQAGVAFKEWVELASDGITYSAATGEFTVPEDGIYKIVLDISLDSDGTANQGLLFEHYWNNAYLTDVAAFTSSLQRVHHHYESMRSLTTGQKYRTDTTLLEAGAVAIRRYSSVQFSKVADS